MCLQETELFFIKTPLTLEGFILFVSNSNGGLYMNIEAPSEVMHTASRSQR